MERVYAFGVIFIQNIQKWFADAEGYFEMINYISNPHNALQVIFPVVSIFDSVFAAQFLLCMGFGEWSNSVLKWWLLEDRPYWWIRETTFYESMRRPRLQQFGQTCETGPGCPSGHNTVAAMQLVLYVMWISHIMNDRHYYIWWWTYVVYPFFSFYMVSVMLARMFVAAHFPHQCLLGAILGLFIAPALCIYVTDPYIWGMNYFINVPNVSTAIMWHCLSAFTTIAISFVTYFGLKICNIDPQWSLHLALKWCNNPENIHVSSTPMYSLVQSTASMLGWAICVTPAVANYRHYTRNRSLIIAMTAAVVFDYGCNQLQRLVDKDRAWCFYLVQFIVYILRPILFLRVVPGLAMLPYYSKKRKQKRR